MYVDTSDEEADLRLVSDDATGSDSSSGPRAAWPSKTCSRIAILGVLLGLVGAIFGLSQKAGPYKRTHPAPSGLSAAPILAAARQPQQQTQNGTIRAMYTFGAPGVAEPPLVNLLDKDGCFQGLRSYTEDVLSPITKQVDAAAISSPYPHAKIATAVLHSNMDSKYVPCPGETDWPNDRKGTEFAEWRLHWQEDYEPRLRALTLQGQDRSGEEPFKSACLSVILSFKTYDTTNHAEDAIRERFPSWKLVAKETLVSGSGALYDEDPMMLFQDHETLDCMVTIAGINYFGKEIATAITVELGSFCGFEGIHTGYRDQFRQLAELLWPRLQLKLPKCRTVSCAGHSMGGALCELLTACVNSQRTSEPDYQQLSWTPQEPAALPEITEGGNVYLPGAERRCPRPPCPK
mmetsp:Transcript_57543/g.168518  ORF Transcript_57543/g.168518 Transcript_57543/m.168518 type:complete len:405 (-) Transcript_57543:68-1282(-)